MKSAFVGGGRLTSVYSEETIAALEREAGLASRAVLSREEVLAGGAADADFVFSTWGMPRFSVDEIRRSLPRVRAVFYAAGSVQGFAREFLECGIPVFSAWAANAVPAVEYAVSQILLANKGFFQACRRYRDRASQADAHRFFKSFPGNYGCAVGILGAGMIGRAVLRKLATEHRLRVLVHDPFYDDAKAAEDGVERASPPARPSPTTSPTCPPRSECSTTGISAGCVPTPRSSTPGAGRRWWRRTSSAP